MGRYFLHLFEDGEYLDEEGSDYRDLAGAKAAASCAARELIAEQLKQGRSVKLSHRIEVADGHGQPVAVVPFREVISFVE